MQSTESLVSTRALATARRVLSDLLVSGGAADRRPDLAEEYPDPDVRASAWTVAIPLDNLASRRVEISGRASPEVAEAAMAVGANVYVADLSTGDALNWESYLAVVAGLAELSTREDSRTALMVKPRTLYQMEARFPGIDVPVSAGVVDAVLFAALRAEMDGGGDGTLFQLPNVTGRAEATVWNESINRIESTVHIDNGSIFATVEVATDVGVAMAEEILWELRKYAVGVNVRYIDDVMGNENSASNVDLARGGSISRDQLREVFEMCNRRGAQAICKVRDDIPLKAGSKSVRVGLSRAVPRSREMIGTG